jgi:adenylate cyclase
MNDGLVVAEVEIPSEDYHVDTPRWVTEEVTGQSKYYNSKLLDNPFSGWNK